MTMMSRILEISVESAQNLPQVRRCGRQMKVFTEVSIAGQASSKKKTAVDEIRGSNPVWNYPMQFSIGHDILLPLLFEIHCICFAGRKRTIGEVQVPLSDLLSVDKHFAKVCHSNLSVITPSGEAKGSLTFAYVVKQGPPSLPLEKWQLDPPENGLSRKKHGRLSNAAAKIGMTGAAAAIATVVTNIII